MKNLILPLLLILFLTTNSYGQDFFEKQGAGVTVIVHGWDPDGNQPTWMTEMANAIVARNGGVGHVASITVTGIQGSLTATCSDWTFNLASQNHAEIVVLVNWTAVANHLNSGISAQEVAAAVAPKIYNGQEGEPALAELPIHLIGHSRGGGMVFEISRLLGLQGIELEHLTALDPHPLTAADPQPLSGDIIDTPVELYENVLFADVYNQNIESPIGEYVNGAYNRLWTSLSGGYHNETGYTYTIGTTNYDFSDHLNIILAYHGTVDLTTPLSNGEATLTQTERDNWYNAFENEGENTGFKYSRIAMGDRKSTDTPVTDGDQIIDGYHSDNFLGGHGAREPLDWTNAVWPNILTAEFEKEGVIQPKGQMVVTADDEISINFTCRSYANDVDVTFFVDTDRNPYNDNNFSTIGTSNIPSTGSAINQASQIWTVGELNQDTRYYIYAEISDNTNKRFIYLPNELSIEEDVSTKISLPDADNISVFPNPVKEVLNIFIEGNKGKVVIANLTGSIVLERTIDDNKAAVDMSGLNAGIYIVKVTSDDKTTVMKVIKK